MSDDVYDPLEDEEAGDDDAVIESKTSHQIHQAQRGKGHLKVDGDDRKVREFLNANKGKFFSRNVIAAKIAVNRDKVAEVLKLMLEQDIVTKQGSRGPGVKYGIEGAEQDNEGLSQRKPPLGGSTSGGAALPEKSDTAGSSETPEKPKRRKRRKRRQRKARMRRGWPPEINEFRKLGPHIDAEIEKAEKRLEILRQFKKYLEAF